MLFETIKSEGLAHLSYLVGDGKEGASAVIDPRRDIDIYLQLAARHQVRITHILETHIHADFVSGSRELSEATSAPVYVGASDGYGFAHKALHDGDTFEIGALTFRVLHTPGHSPEHVCYVVSGGGKGAEGEWAVFTGDTLFAGEVGRPDLGPEASKEELARALYHSLHEKLLVLADGLEVYPAHGEGSPCGGSIGVRDRTTIGYERNHNDKLRLDDEDSFVKSVLESLPPEPFYYSRMKRINAQGPEVLGAWPQLFPLTPQEFKERIQDDTLVVDTREVEAFAGAHLKGSLNLALRASFPIWAGWMLKPEEPILLVLADSKDVEMVQRHLRRIGIERVGGHLKQGMRGWIEAALPFETTGRLSVHDLHERLGRVQLLDVRSDSEWQSGHIPTARHIYLPYLEEHLDTLERNEPIAVYCGSGYRSSIAASILRRHGFSVSNVLGSMSAWKAAGYPFKEP